MKKVSFDLMSVDSNAFSLRELLVDENERL